MTGVLDGIRVLDFGRYIAGPACGMLLADMGAEVIRVEKIDGSEDRFVQPVTETGDVYSWGIGERGQLGHGDLENNHNKHAGATDKPIAGLLADLKQRGLLDSTIVVWGGEFGRQPTAEYAKGTGRDHNSAGFTMWLAGGGIKKGVSVGTTDELGNEAVEKPMHVKHLHATILHQLGLDPNRLSFFHAGLDQRLVGTEGANPISDLIA